MPIFEYHCQDCGSDFEKLVRKAGDAVACPTCGDDKPANLEIRYSTFAAHANGAPKAAAAPNPAVDARPGCAEPPDSVAATDEHFRLLLLSV